MKTHVIIYSRPGCHLCEEAKAAIAEAGSADLYTLTEVNIETDPGLLNRYKNDIPVITFDGVEVFRHQVKPSEFRAVLLKQSGQ